MKTQINNENNNNVLPVQQQGRMATQGPTWLRLALFAAIILTIAMPAMASCPNSVACTNTIQRLYVQPFPGTPNVLGLYVELANGEYPSGCTPVSGVFFRLNSTDFGGSAFGQLAFTQMYDLLLAAKNTHSIVTLRSTTSTPPKPCNIAYVVQETP